MNSDEQVYTYRITRKVRTGGSSLLAGFCILVGLMFLIFIFWPVGLVLIIGGVLVDAKTKYISICGNCGNEVSHTSTLCPTCHADLAAEPRGRRWFR